MSDYVIFQHEEVVHVKYNQDGAMYVHYPASTELKAQGILGVTLEYSNPIQLELWGAYIEKRLRETDFMSVKYALAELARHGARLVIRNRNSVDRWSKENDFWETSREVIFTSDVNTATVIARCLHKLGCTDKTLKEKVEAIADIGVISLGTVYVDEVSYESVSS